MFVGNSDQIFRFRRWFLAPPHRPTQKYRLVVWRRPWASPTFRMPFSCRIRTTSSRAVDEVRGATRMQSRVHACFFFFCVGLRRLELRVILPHRVFSSPLLPERRWVNDSGGVYATKKATRDPWTVSFLFIFFFRSRVI